MREMSDFSGTRGGSCLSARSARVRSGGTASAREIGHRPLVTYGWAFQTCESIFFSFPNPEEVTVYLQRLSFSLALVLAAVPVACSAGGGGEKGLTGAGANGAGGATGNSSSGMGGDDIIIPPSTGSGTPSQCGNTLEVTHRDFNETHPDFEMPFSGDVVRLQLVQPTLAADLTPVFRDSIGCPQDGGNPTQCANWMPTEPVIKDADSFYQWYHTVDGVNIKFSKKLELTEQPPGSGTFVFDSDAFFPLDASEGFGVSPAGHFMMKNFLFTTEIHLNFEYKAGQKFTFRGDDDLWIFVNGKLALDIGSMHSPAQGTIDFDAQAAALGIAPGQTYAMDIFQAERHTTGSNFRFETNISCFIPGPVPK
jgi:fibro-slime domain-containing protein